MGSPLGPILANIFVGFHERQLFEKFPKPFIYLRYVDDTFVVSSSSETLKFFHKLNDLHPSLYSLLNTQHYKVRIKGKVEQSREGVAPSPTPWCSSCRKGSLWVTLDYGRQLYFYFFLLIVHYGRGKW